MDFGQILDSKSYDQVCKYASMPVCQYARMQVYTCLHKKLNKKIFEIMICFIIGYKYAWIKGVMVTRVDEETNNVAIIKGA